MRRQVRERQKKRRKAFGRFQRCCVLPLCGRSEGSTAKKLLVNAKERQQPFCPIPNGVGDCTTTVRRLLIGADS